MTMSSLVRKADQIVVDADDRRTACAGSDRDVIEAELPGVLDRQGPTETNASVAPEAVSSRQNQINDFEKILVPANRDSVFGDAAKSGEHPFIEILVQLREIPDRLWRLFAVTDQVRG